MAVKYYNSEEELDDAFDDFCETNEKHTSLKEEVEDAESSLEEAKYQLENASAELQEAEERLVQATKELEEFEDENRDSLIGNHP